MSEIERLKAEIEMLQEILPLEEELEAARAVKDTDPERWFNAKQAYEPVRTYWRQIAEYLRSANDPGISAGSVNVEGTLFDVNGGGN